MNLDEDLRFCAFPIFISLSIEMNGEEERSRIIVSIKNSVVIAVVSLKHLLSQIRSTDDTVCD